MRGLNAGSRAGAVLQVHFIRLHLLQGSWKMRPRKQVPAPQSTVRDERPSKS